MDADQIRSLKPELRTYLAGFADCFGRSDTRGHLSVYVEGQLSDLPRKSCEPIADAQGMPPRTLQQFLSLLDWDHGLMKTKLQHLVAAEHASPHSIGIIDETGCPKKGEKTPGVSRQWCGATGKTDNCVVTVHLGYAVDDFHCLVDSELFLPEVWSNDRPRCQRADIPDEMVHRPKTDIALELYDRARSKGMVFTWLTFDEGYGKSVAFLDALRARRQCFVAEVPVTCTGWIVKPRVTTRPRHPGGRPAQKPRLVSRTPLFRTVREMLDQEPELRDQPWQAWHVKDGEKGPMVWEVKHVWFYPRGVDDLPQAGAHLMVARNVLEPETIKFFVAHAPPQTSVGVLLKVAFSRWRVERCFEDEKTELGFDHFEGRSYVGLMRHQTITALTHLFLARTHQAWRGGKSGVDRVPSANRSRHLGPIVVTDGPHADPVAPTHCRHDQPNPTPQSRLSQKPSKTNSPTPTPGQDHTPESAQVSVA
jgi:SRSO17 transposase